MDTFKIKHNVLWHGKYLDGVLTVLRSPDDYPILKLDEMIIEFTLVSHDLTFVGKVTAYIDQLDDVISTIEENYKEFLVIYRKENSCTLQ